MTDRVKELEYEVEALKRQVAEMGSLFNHARAAGLDDLIAGHGFQRFVADGKGRLDETGLQFLTSVETLPAGGVAYNDGSAALRFVDAFFLPRDEAPANNPYRPQAWVQGAYTPTGGASGGKYGALALGAQNIWAQGRGILTLAVDENPGVSTSTTVALLGYDWDALDPTNTTPAGIVISSTITQKDTQLYGQLVLESRTANPTYTVTDGSMHYRSDTDKARLRANSAWVNLASEDWVSTQERLYDETFAFFMGGA